MTGSRLRVMTVVGTRPEMIRLSRVIVALDHLTEHVLVHTGQNFDHQLKDVFFTDLGIRTPDHYLDIPSLSPGQFMGGVLAEIEKLLVDQRPDAFVVLGDTNSAISAIMARRLKIPVYHLEAGNRSFDPNVPEEVNRRMVDHVADYHLVYSEHSRRNLLAEGIDPQTICVIGSPMNEVLNHYADKIEQSTILDDLSLQPHGYVVASAHREENVDQPARLAMLLESLDQITQLLDCPVVFSTHPRTRRRIEDHRLSVGQRIRLEQPFGFFDYIQLQRSAKVVLSDSGTISEEAMLLGFPAVTMRDAIERPEALETGAVMTSGLRPADVLDSVRHCLWQHNTFPKATPPADYQITDTSRRVVAWIRSTVSSHHRRLGLRQFPIIGPGGASQEVPR